MKLKIRKRLYKMKDADLVQDADDKINSATRDAAELLAYGVTPATIADITTARTSFNSFDPDIFYMAEVMIATENKNISRQAILTQIRQIAGRAGLQFGEDSAKYRKFDTKNLSQNTDNDLFRVARSVISAATEYLAELTPTGLTMPIIAALEAITNTFDTQIDTQKTKIKARDIAVDERIALGNTLYTLLAKLCEQGKLCFETVNEAKYNDYIIYKSTATPAAQFETDGTVAPNAVGTSTVSGIEDSTNITLKNTSSSTLQFYFAQNVLDMPGAVFIMVPPNTQQTHIATALGYNEALDITRLNIFNPNPTESSYTVLWD